VDDRLGRRRRAHTGAGQAYRWGENGGRLGNGDTANESLPAPVSQPAGVLFSAISAGDHKTCALAKSTGYAYCWGGLNFTGPALVSRRAAAGAEPLAPAAGGQDKGTGPER
jgi:hypothetical protein